MKKLNITPIELITGLMMVGMILFIVLMWVRIVF